MRTPATWPLALVPVIAAFVLIVVSWIVLTFLFGEVAAPWFRSYDANSGWLGWLVSALLALVIAFFVGTALAQPVSGPALDALVRAQDAALGVPAPPKSPFWTSFGRSLRVTFFTVLVGAPPLVVLTLVELVFPPLVVVTWPAKLFFSALVATWNFVDYPFGARGFGVRRRLAWVSAHIGASLGFGAVLAILAFIPFVGLLVLPVGVVGATRLVHATSAHDVPR